MTFPERVQNLTEPFTGGTSPSLDLITSIARAHSWMLFLVNAVDVVGSSLLMMVSRFSRRFNSVSSSLVICSAFVLASLTLLVYVFSFSNSCMEREMTPKMVPATSAMMGVRKVRRWDEAIARNWQDGYFCLEAQHGYAAYRRWPLIGHNSAGIGSALDILSLVCFQPDLATCTLGNYEPSQHSQH